MHNEYLLLHLAINGLLIDEELLYMICCCRQIGEDVLCTDRQDSPLVLQLVLDHVKLTVKVWMLNFRVNRLVRKHSVFHEGAVLVELELAYGSPSTRVKCHSHELVLRDDLLATICALL